MVFDGDCQFCRRWISRWKHATAGAVDYLEYQDPVISSRYPQIPQEDLQKSVHLILPDGSVSRGAEAVFRSLAEGGRHRWLFGFYRRAPAFAELSELLYEEVALHRTALSKLDRIYAGPGIEAPGHIWVRFIFLRGLALIYLIAFLSFWMQADGLTGSRGIMPTQEVMTALNKEASQANIGLQRFLLVPSLAWWNAGDRALHWQCGLGTACSLALMAGCAPTLMLLLLWALYLSLSSVSGPFLDFQWDTLLTETGFLAVFFAPLQAWERPSRQGPPPASVLWLLRWLLFRLMFESGFVKLVSGDAAWWNLTALRFHFQTQPLPTWIGWEAGQLPSWVLSFFVLVMFGIELIVPTLIFSGRRLRLAAAGILAGFQVLIMLTGNYGFFNWLTILLCVPLLDDHALAACWRRTRETRDAGSPVLRPARWPGLAMICLTAVVVPLTLIPFLVEAGVRQRWPAPVVWLYGLARPWRSFNGYGLFRVMTRTRPEIIVQGSEDGRHWRDYEFKYKPGDLNRSPGFVAPHQPRLDWQMWFAALDRADALAWFVRFEHCLLRNSPAVLALLGPNPFPRGPPRYVRALLYEYRFTDRATRRRTGEWWQREYLGVYVPPLSLEDFERDRRPARTLSRHWPEVEPRCATFSRWADGPVQSARGSIPRGG
jgi:predicted DCC family thiol-disulfide oxidoreductase YuxK